MLRGLADKFYQVVGLVPQTVTASGASAVLDVKGFRNFAFLIATGVMAFTGANFLTFKIQECDTQGGTFTDVANYYSADLLVYNAGSFASAVNLIQYRGNKRYIKLVWTVSGVVSVPMSVVGASTNLETMPNA